MLEVDEGCVFLSWCWGGLLVDMTDAWVAFGFQGIFTRSPFHLWSIDDHGIDEHMIDV